VFAVGGTSRVRWRGRQHRRFAQALGYGRPEGTTDADHGHGKPVVAAG